MKNLLGELKISQLFIYYSIYKSWKLFFAFMAIWLIIFILLPNQIMNFQKLVSCICTGFTFGSRSNIDLEPVLFQDKLSLKKKLNQI